MQLPSLYTAGIPNVLQAEVIFMLILGTVVGIIIGALPGLTVTMGVALLTPLTFRMETAASFALLLGAYCGGTYGGSITAILLRIPGALPAVMTTLDGYPMAQRGEAGRALGITITTSVIGGVVSALVLALLAPPLAELAVKFSAQEYLAVAIFALSVIAYVSQEDMVKGLLSGCFGLLIAMVGTDPNAGFPRFTADLAELVSGVELVPLMIGLFGLAEVLTSVEKPVAEMQVIKQLGKILPSWGELWRLTPTMIRGSIVGVFIGILPAAGSSIASIVSYGVEKRVSKHPEKFGTGVPEGIAAPETANNACTGGDMVPTLSLGIPGSSSTAILMGALLLHGLQPGPTLFTEHPDVVSAIFILMLLANLAFFFLGLIGANLFTRVIDAPPPLLVPSILMLCVVGSYAIRNSLFDVAVMITSGILGYSMRKAKVPPAPLILGLILGPMVESNLQRVMVLSYGDFGSLFNRPISLGFLLVTAAFLFSPWLIARLVSRQRREQFANEDD